MLVWDNEGIGVSTSAEVGYRFDFPLGGMDFSVAPQVQLVWSRVDFDDFTGLQGGLISLEDGDLMMGRLSLSWDGEWQDIRGSGSIYGGVSLRDALDGRTAVSVSGSRSPVSRGCRLTDVLAFPMSGTMVTRYTVRQRHYATTT